MKGTIYIMNELQVFQNDEFGKIRVIEKDGEPWFVGVDVTKALGYSNPSAEGIENKHYQRIRFILPYLVQQAANG